MPGWCLAPRRCRGGDVAFGSDQLVEPADLPLRGVLAVLLQGRGVGVHPLAVLGRRGADGGHGRLETAARALEDAEPDLGLGAGEEPEVDVERVVLPSARTGLLGQLLEVLLAVGGELVDDAGAL